MRTFSYSALREKRWYPEMESLAGSVSAAARRTEPLLQEKGDDLQALARAARLKNITASNAIEGITAPDSRISLLCDGKDDPQSTAEQQIAGYADAHDVILESFDAIPLTPNYILQLHKILYGRTGATWAGKTKSVQNYISATYPDLRRRRPSRRRRRYRTSAMSSDALPEQVRLISSLRCPSSSTTSSASIPSMTGTGA